MSTGFQFIFDNAGQLSVNKQPDVAQTISRDGTVRATSRGNATWAFSVGFADGIQYSQLREVWETVLSLGKHTTDTIQLNSTGYSTWFTKYLGDSGVVGGWEVDTISGATCKIKTVPSGTGLSVSDKIFKSGDLIQLGTSGHVYTVTTDVTWTGDVSTVTAISLDRAIIEADATYTLKIGPDCSWKVRCTNLPNYTVFDYNLATFTGNFEFVEDMASY